MSKDTTSLALQPPTNPITDPASNAVSSPEDGDVPFDVMLGVTAYLCNSVWPGVVVHTSSLVIFFALYLAAMLLCYSAK